MKINKNIKRIVIDMLINIVGTGFPIAVLQLIIYPIVAKRIDANSYGEMQSIMSILYLVAGTLGGTLSTTRLIREQEYQSKKIIGDFSIIFWICSLCTFISTPIILFFYLEKISILDVGLITFLALLLFSVNYLEVGFRLELNYKRMFIVKVATSVGYLIGFCLFSLTLKWQFIFIFSYILPLIYCLCKTTLIREPLKKTHILKKTGRSFCDLTIASALSKSQTYFDKLLLYPLLGGAAVSVYFAANIFGKLILQILEPITNVILSYISRRNTVGKDIWSLTFVLGGVFCVVMYVVCMFISGPILHIFYPQWADQALRLVPIATASLCVSSFVSIIYPLTLKTLNTNKQIIINGSGLVVYIMLTMLSYKKWGLIGCCISLLFSYCTKLFIILVLYFRSHHGKKSIQ